jgi:LuxR family transcriptional regulator, quorum-sensing system regulator CciR
MSRLVVAAQFVEQARVTLSTAELRRMLEDVSREIGFRHFALVDHVDLREKPPHAVRLENYPETWASQFVEKALYAEDPIHRACLVSVAGFAWAEVPKLIKLTGRQQTILEEAAKHGLGSGYTIPIIIPGEPSGSCSFVTRPGFDLPIEDIVVAQSIGVFALQAARRLARQDLPSQPSPPQLTSRQHDCLLLAMHGKSDWHIGRMLGISHETVNRHFDIARGRFDVATRQQLAVRALFDGQISFIEALSRQLPDFGK